MELRARARRSRPRTGRATLIWALLLAAVTALLVSLSGTAAGLSGRLAPATKVDSSRLRSARRAQPATAPRIRPARRLARRLARCQTGQLDVQFGAGGQDGPDATQVVTFLNTSHRACTLDGYPGLRLNSARGGSMAIHQHDGYLYAVPEASVRLQPGRTASFAVAFRTKADSGRLRCPRSKSVDIRPPGAADSIGVGWKIAPYGGTVSRPRCGVVLVSPVYRGSGQPPTKGVRQQIRSTSGLSGSSADLAGDDQHPGGRGVAHRRRVGLVDVRGGRAPHRPLPA